VPPSRPVPAVVVDEKALPPSGRLSFARPLVVALPLIGWLILWSFWALWGIFVPLMVLILGRNPRAVWKEIVGFLQYVLRVTAYLSLTFEEFPGYRNRNEHPVSFELEYPPRLSRLLALARIVLNPLTALIGFALIGIKGVAAFAQLMIIVFTGQPNLRLHAFQVRLLKAQGRTFAFFLSLTDRLPW